MAARELPGHIPQVMLVLDATPGQNGLRQAEVFKEATGLTGVILTQLLLFADLEVLKLFGAFESGVYRTVQAA